MRRVCVSVLALAAIVAGGTVRNISAQGAPAKITVESTAFKDGETLPDDYSSFGKNVSPPLSWSGAPATDAAVCRGGVPRSGRRRCRAASRTGSSSHKIPASAKGLPEAHARRRERDGLRPGWRHPGRERICAFARRGGPPPEPSYRGPAPPAGPAHHYHFTVYAIDGAADLQPGLDRSGLPAKAIGVSASSVEIVDCIKGKRRARGCVA